MVFRVWPGVARRTLRSLTFTPKMKTYGKFLLNRLAFGLPRLSGATAHEGTNMGSQQPGDGGKDLLTMDGDDRHWRGGFYFEGLIPGNVYRHRLSRTVTQMDNMLFSNMTMNPQPLHVDRHFCQNDTQWGQPLMNSIPRGPGE